MWQAARIASALEASSARGAVTLGLGLVDFHGAPVHVCIIKGLDRRIGFRIVVHFDESEAFRLTAEFVGDQVDLGHFAKTGEGLAQICIGDAVKHQAQEFLRQENAACRHGEVRVYKFRGKIVRISSKLSRHRVSIGGQIIFIAAHFNKYRGKKH